MTLVARVTTWAAVTIRPGSRIATPVPSGAVPAGAPKPGLS